MKPTIEASFTQLVKLGQSMDLELTESTITKCLEFAKLLIEANKERNLTRLTEPDKLVTGMFLDSLMFLHAIKGKKHRTIIDIGCGAGFPAIPLAIALPKSRITAVDSRQMKCKFVSEACEQLKLSNIRVVHGKAEEIKKMGYFEIAVSRALAKLPKALEIMLPFLKPGGLSIIASGTRDLKALLPKALNTAKKLSAIHLKTEEYRLPGYDNYFCHVIFKKR